MRILITGGAGFIGSNLIHFLLKKYPGYDIINLDRLAPSGNLENLLDVARLPMYHFVQGDICNEVEVDALMSQGVEVVIHIATEPYPDLEEQDPARFIRTDMYGAYVLAQAAVAYKVTRFIYVSRADVYGTAATSGPTLAAVEDDVARPVQAHVASKLGGERLALSYFYSHALPVIVARPSQIYGPYQYPDQFLAYCLTQALSDEIVEIGGLGQEVADWLHVEDLCQGLDVLLHARRREVEGQVFNVATGHQRSQSEVIDLILHFLDKPRDSVRFNDQEASKVLPRLIDASKLERLGWSASINFQQGLSQTLLWYQQNMWWWEKLRQPGQTYLAPKPEDDADLLGAI